MKLQRSFLSFAKFLGYTAIVFIGTEIATKNTLLLNWKAVLMAAAVAVVKAAMTWVSTEDK